MNLLELTGVTKTYGDLHALAEVDLTVPRGEWLSIVGPSGSGKTTLMNIVGCMDRPTGGSVVLDGTDVATLGAQGLTRVRRSTIGLIFQKFHLVGHLTAVENVMVAQYYHSMPDQAEALEALQRVGLGERATHLPSQLSGGEQQRVAIARALVGEPRVLLADEPTGNLDSANGAEVMAILERLNGERGVAVVLVTHEAEIADRADRLIRVRDGLIVEDRPRDALVAEGGERAR